MDNPKVGCEKCAHTGKLRNGALCECYRIAAHHHVCQMARLTPAAVVVARGLDLDSVGGPLPIDVMVERRLGVVLVGDLFRAHAYIAASIWHDLDTYVRFDSTEYRRTIKCVEIKEDLEQCDVLCVPLYRDPSFPQRSFYERVNGLCSALIMTLPISNTSEMAVYNFFGYDSKSDARESADKLVKVMAARVALMAETCGINVPTRPWPIYKLPVSAWDGV